MKRIISVFFCCICICRLLIFPADAAPSWPSDTGIMAEGGIVMDVDSKTVLFGQTIHQPYAPASITKLLTALVAIENSRLDDVITFSDDAVNNVEEGSGNKINVVPGDQLSVEDCLYALLLCSSNQAGNALAEHVAGSRDEFVRMMNERIAAIGCTESHFCNPSGLNDDNQYVSAYDMALISIEAFSNEKLLEIASGLSRKLGPTTNSPGGITVYAEHRLVKTTDPSSQFYYPAAKAGKTGYTSIAGNTLVTYAEQDGRRLVSVILKGKPTQYFLDGKTLLEFGFARFHNVNIAENETQYVSGDEEIHVGGSFYAPKDLMIEKDPVVTIPLSATFADVKKTLVTELPDDAPRGAVAAVSYSYNERKVGEAYLLLKEIPADWDSQKNHSTPTLKNENQSHTGAGDIKDGVVSGETTPAQSKSGGRVMLLTVFLLLILAAGAAIAWVAYRKKKEAEALAARRQKRRERLMRERVTDEEFERLLEERRQKRRKR